MKKAVKEFFSQIQNESFCIELQEEVFCGENGRKRCDLGGVEKDKNIATSTIGIEIKQSIEDFHTGYGMNFTFDYNYLCVPSGIVGYALRYLAEHRLDAYVGVIEYCDANEYKECGMIEFVKYCSLNKENNIDGIMKNTTFPWIHPAGHVYMIERGYILHPDIKIA